MTNYTTYPNITDLNFSDGAATALLNYGSSATGGFLPIGVLFLFTAVVFMASYTPGRGKIAFATSGITSMITAFLLVGAGLLHPFFLFAAVAYMIYGVYLVVFDSPY